MFRRIRGIRKILVNMPWYWHNLSVFGCASKG